MCLVLTRAQIEGSAIPEAVPVEGVVPEVEVIAGEATEPAQTTAPGVTEEVRDDALPETSLDCRMDLPGPTTSVGTRTDYSVGPWDYPACAARHLMA
jgi:hypothetical protein